VVFFASTRIPYDTLNRLTSAQNTGTDCAATTVNGKTEYWGNGYGYDAWGNLLQKNVTKCSAEGLTVTADAHNWIHASGTDYQYDAAGNMTFNATPPTQTYTYDQENRLTGAAGYAYTYDGDGNRVRKSSGSTGTLYWYMTPGIVGESDLSGNLTDEYVFFDGERVARKSTNGVFYYFSDHLKTASVTTDSAGNIKSESDFYPWGGELQFVSNDSNHYKFTGKERDSETQLDYFGARYYSNGLGRWVSADWSPTPIPVPYANFHDPQSLNLYGFVGGNPASKADPDGHCPWCLVQLASWFAKAVQRDGGVKPAIKNAATGAAQGLGSLAFHAATAQGTPLGALQPLLKLQEGRALQPKNQTQADAKLTTVVAGTVASFFAPSSGPAAAEGLADSALVVRGGVPTATQLTKGAESIATDGTLSGVSVQSANGATVEQLSQGIPNNQIGVTTVGDVRAAGGDVVSTPIPDNPCHCDMSGVTAEQGSKLFKTQPNPSKVKASQGDN
jgi:RHS repeat-associated protein